MEIQTKAKCGECGRVFDLLDEDDASEWAFGHDCELLIHVEIVDGTCAELEAMCNQTEENN